MTLILTQEEVRALLPMDVCVELVADALETLARGEAINPLRWGVRIPDLGILGMMPGYMETPPTLGLKVVSVFPGNHGTAFDAHQGVVVLFETEHGVPSAIVDASEITAIRTAAASGVATRLLAREDAGDLAILGTGVQAWSHVRAMALVRDLRRVRVFSRDPGRRTDFAVRASEALGLDVRPVESAESAVRGADLVCTTTSASEPVLHGAWLSPGAHVNAVGSSVRSARELDGEVLARARLFVDLRESTVNEAGDFISARDEGVVDEGDIAAELGEILLGRKGGREHPDEITLFESLGLAVEDLVAAHHVARRAREEGVGVEVPLGGSARGAD